MQLLSLLLFLTLSVPVFVQAWDVQLSCPEGAWTNNSLVTLTCLVRKSSYDTSCASGQPHETQFRVTRGPQTAPRCTAPSVTACSPTGSDSDGFCACASSNNTYYTLKRTFRATDSDAGTWDCNVLCFDGADQPLTAESQHCDNKEIRDAMVTTTSAEITTGNHEYRCFKRYKTKRDCFENK